MDIKTLLIMGLLSFGLAGCANAQNKQGNSNVKELTKEQKEKLKEMYEMYQYFQIKPGISENVTVKERIEPLPWVETERDILCEGVALQCPTRVWGILYGRR